MNSKDQPSSPILNVGKQGDLVNVDHRGIQVPRPLHGDIADSAISRLTGDITKIMLVAKKIEMQVGGLVPSHFNCIMIGAIIYMQKSNMLNISSYGC